MTIHALLRKIVSVPKYQYDTYLYFAIGRKTLNNSSRRSPHFGVFSDGCWLDRWWRFIFMLRLLRVMFVLCAQEYFPHSYLLPKFSTLTGCSVSGHVGSSMRKESSSSRLFCFLVCHPAIISPFRSTWRKVHAPYAWWPRRSHTAETCSYYESQQLSQDATLQAHSFPLFNQLLVVC